MRCRGVVQYVQRKCHSPVYPRKNAIYSYPEALLIIVLKPYLQRKRRSRDKHNKDIFKKVKDLNQLFDHTENLASYNCCKCCRALSKLKLK